jgi:hypothetical protein
MTTQTIFEIQLGTLEHFLDQIDLALTDRDKFYLQIEAAKIGTQIKPPRDVFRRDLDYFGLAIFFEETDEARQVIDRLKRGVFYRSDEFVSVL